jgi:hypothetical protein
MQWSRNFIFQHGGTHTTHIRSAWPLTKQPLQILMRRLFSSRPRSAHASHASSNPLRLALLPGSLVRSRSLLSSYERKSSPCVRAPSERCMRFFPLRVSHCTIYRRAVCIFRSALRLRNLSGGHGGVRALLATLLGRSRDRRSSVVGGLHHQRTPPALLRPVGNTRSRLLHTIAGVSRRRHVLDFEEEPYHGLFLPQRLE